MQNLQDQRILVAGGCQTDGAGGITIPEGQQGVGANGGWTFTGVTPASGEIRCVLAAESLEDRTVIQATAQGAAIPYTVLSSYAGDGNVDLTVFAQDGTTPINLSTTAVSITLLAALT